MKMLFFIFAALLPAFSSGAALEPSLDGSPEAQAFENAVADSFGLRRIEHDTELAHHIKIKALVPLSKNGRIRWHKDLKPKYAYVLPHVWTFLRSAERNGHPIVISSAVRPKAYQEMLRKRNGNAASSEGPMASSHSTGSTVDLSYKGLTKKQVRRFARYLLELERQGKIQVTMERFQACFHVMVFPTQKH